MEKQIMWNGKTFKPLKKFVAGAFLLSSFFALFYGIGGHDGLTKMEKSIKVALLPYMPEDLAYISGLLVTLALGLYMVYAAVSGTYRICTFNMYLNTFDSKQAGGVSVVGNSAYPNINRVLKYRDSKLSGMSPEAGADLFVRSAKIEALTSGTYNSGPETLRTVSYIESKLSGMSSDRGLNYLANSL